MKETKEQLEAICHVDGPCLVEAGPGSGKTTTLIKRVTHLIEQGISPDSILCITFTNNAAREMKERLLLSDGMRFNNVHASTIHGLCKMVLEEELEIMRPELRGFSLLTSFYTKKKLMRDWVEDRGYDVNFYPFNLHFNRISYAKENLLGPSELRQDVLSHPDKYATLNGEDEGSEFEWSETIAFYVEYEKKKQRLVELDFDDLLYYTILLFRHFPNVLSRWQDRFKYIMVDEFQDVNSVQFEIIRMLADKYQNIWVCGDYLQSIYEWRGANPQIILREFLEYYPNAKVVNLHVNFRSASAIVDFSNKVAKKSARPRNIKSFHEDSGQVTVSTFLNRKDELFFVCEKIKDILPTLADGEKIGVLVRTNRNIGSLERVFYQNGICYYSNRNSSFFSSAEVKDITAWIRVIVYGDKASKSAFHTVFKRPPKGLGDKFFSVWSVRATSHGGIEALLQDYGRYEWNLAAVSLYEVILKLRDFHKQNPTLGRLIHEIRQLSRYDEWVKNRDSGNARQIIDTLDELEAMVDAWGKDGHPISAEAFLKEVGKIAANNSNADEKVHISTIHGAKGLEYEVVFMPFVEEGNFPSPFSENLEEELRLFYVGVTRAERQLLISASRAPSPLLEETLYVGEEEREEY